MTVGDFLATTTRTFKEAGIATARLDAQLLLSHALGKNKVWLLAHPEHSFAIDAKLVAAVNRRANREPLAYILGHKEFYGHDFIVTPDVLIPRPETEQLIDELRALPIMPGATLLDVGTGSGAIAITAALELPRAKVAACDISPAALAIAQKNATRLGAHIQFFVADLLKRAGTYDIIIANLPYVGRDWQRSPETQFEPSLALFADDNGLALIKKLLTEAPDHLPSKGFLLIESDPQQSAAIAAAASAKLRLRKTQGFVHIFQKT